MRSRSDRMTPAADGRKLVWMTLGAALVAAGAQVDVPMYPVPMSLQSLFIVLAGAALGARWGTAAVVVYLFAGAAGLPVFSGGASGLTHFTGPTAGYLMGFVAAAAWVGFRCRAARASFLRTATEMIVGHVWILGLGALWLSTHIGWAKAWLDGVAPFIVGAACKSVVAAGLAKVWWSLMMTPKDNDPE